MAGLMHKWDIEGPISNPPTAHALPPAFNYLQQYAIDMAYVPPQRPSEARKLYKRHIYDNLHHMHINGDTLGEIRIVTKYPNTAWGRVWKNLHSNALPTTIISTWYVTIHDTVSTNARLAAIHLTPTSTCPNCGLEDTIQHRITDCGEGPITWNWTQTRLGMILRMNPTYIPKEWTTRPDFTLWPPQRHAAFLWIIAQLVHYRLQTHRRLSLSDFKDFLRRSRWKPRPRTGRASPHRKLPRDTRVKATRSMSRVFFRVAFKRPAETIAK